MTKTDEPVSIVIKIPEELRELGEVFYVLRLHNGEAVLLSDLDDDPETVTISTDRFSTYVLIYQPKKGAADAVSDNSATVTADAGGGDSVKVDGADTEDESSSDDAIEVKDTTKKKDGARVLLIVFLIVLLLGGVGAIVFLIIKEKKAKDKQQGDPNGKDPKAGQQSYPKGKNPNEKQVDQNADVRKK